MSNTASQLLARIPHHRYSVTAASGALTWEDLVTTWGAVNWTPHGNAVSKAVNGVTTTRSVTVGKKIDAERKSNTRTANPDVKITAYPVSWTVNRVKPLPTVDSLPCASFNGASQSGHVPSTPCSDIDHAHLLVLSAANGPGSEEAVAGNGVAEGKITAAHESVNFVVLPVDSAVDWMPIDRAVDGKMGAVRVGTDNHAFRPPRFTCGSILGRNA